MRENPKAGIAQARVVVAWFVKDVVLQPIEAHPDDLLAPKAHNLAVGRHVVPATLLDQVAVPNRWPWLLPVGSSQTIECLTKHPLLVAALEGARTVTWRLLAPLREADDVEWVPSRALT